MKKFIKALFLYCVTVCCFFAVVVIAFLTYISPQYSQNYAASILDKYERLMSIEGSKIVLAGDSNVVFGIDSEKWNRH